MRNFIFSVFFLFVINGFAQEFNINKYKYVIVDSKFDFVKKPDQYKLSSLTKFLFNKIGMQAFLDTDEYPEELSKDPCQALFASADKKPGLLTLKTYIEIKDCFGRTLYTSEIGKSKTKEFERGYYQTINRAFKSIEALNYTYDPSLADKQAKKTNTTAAVKKEVVDSEPVKVEIKQPKKVTPKPVINKPVETADNLLIAQKNENGFLLVNKDKTVFTILSTKQKDIYILKDKNGILIKKENHWIAQYYRGGELVSEKYQIKF